MLQAPGLVVSQGLAGKKVPPTGFDSSEAKFRIFWPLTIKNQWITAPFSKNV
jgi:hypothetical protein